MTRILGIFGTFCVQKGQKFIQNFFEASAWETFNIKKKSSISKATNSNVT